MKFKDLREFISFLENKGELRRITAPVSHELEITEITDRVIKAGGPALLFENVTGFDTHCWSTCTALTNGWPGRWG